MIGACRPNSPAAEAGLKPGDRIVEIDGRKIARAAEVKEELSRRYAGDKVRVVVLRDEKRIECDVELVAKLEPYEHPFLGILPMRTPSGERPPGVAVRYVYPDSPAAEAGIEPGDVLVSLGGRADRGPRRAAARRSPSYQPDDEVELEVRRGDETRKLTADARPAAGGAAARRAAAGPRRRASRATAERPAGRHRWR